MPVGAMLADRRHELGLTPHQAAALAGILPQADAGTRRWGNAHIDDFPLTPSGDKAGASTKPALSGLQASLDQPIANCHELLNSEWGEVWLFSIHTSLE